MNIKDILKKYKKPSKKGLSLVELIAVITILAITSTATLTVFLMVRQITEEASDITIDQYNTTSVERFIRNELSVASNIDIATVENFKNKDSGVMLDDEYITFDGSRVEFYRAMVDSDSGGIEFEKVYTISGVEHVKFSIVPVDSNITDTNVQPYKLFYTIKTVHYDYSGGFIMNNTIVGDEDDSMLLASADASINPTNFVWGNGSSDNNKAICFHREKTKKD